MNCEWVSDNLDAYELGALDAPARESLEAHVASCAACRKALAEARAADAAVRAALRWAEPSPAFAPRVAALARRRVVFRCLAVAAGLAAAVALIICAALIRFAAKRPETHIAIASKQPEAAAESLLAGEVYDAYGVPASRLVPGRPYVAAQPAALSVDPGSLLLMSRGSQFAAAAARRNGTDMTVLAGNVVGQVGARGKELAIELAPELGGAIVRTKGCEFYSAGFPAHRLAAELPFPPGALAHWPGEIRVHVFSGHLDIDLGTQKLALGAGDSAVISGGVSAGTARALERRIGELRTALGEEALEERELYTGLCEGYARRLLELRTAAPDDALPHRPERLELVEGLLHDHAAAIERIEAENPALLELDAATAELHRLEQLHEEADGALERFVTLVAYAG
ncbi:MAG: zf-HC2 domain-containing protein [Planctomycetes bacterium]|nr:zf-HC2 domain-containing protein [Planctomycetota bacterium]